MTAASLPIPTDAQLWSQVCAGDVDAFEDVVERHQSAVSAVAYNVCGDMSASEDVAQEAFWTAWRERASLQEPDKLRAWLCGIGRNVARNVRRRTERNAGGGDVDRLADPEPTPPEAAVSREEQSLVWDSLEQIPETYREPLVLFYREDHSVADVARALDLSEDAVKQRLSRGRAMLREQVAELVEHTLTRSRPSKSFTLAVLAGLGIVAKDSGMAMAGTTASVAGKSAMGITAAALPAGTMGAALGTAGGLAGGWLGTWLPAQMAPTVRERDALLRTGRRMLIVSIAMTALLVAAIWWSAGRRNVLEYLLILLGWMLLFGGYVLIETLRLVQRQKQIRAESSPEDLPNDSAVRARALQMAARYRGRSYRSATTLLGLPLVDIQTRDPVAGLAPDSSGHFEPQVARGWIAIGDVAHGVLFAYGGKSRAIVATGGRTLGVFSFGGMAVGLVAVGGVAVGGIAVGGLGLGILGIGGLGVGWWAAGGGALAVDTAAGGGAAALHAAFGGAAVAREFAVGGSAFARHANDAAAHAFLDHHPLKSGMDWFMAHSTAVTWIAVAGSIVLPLLLARLGYQRVKPESAS